MHDQCSIGRKEQVHQCFQRIGEGMPYICDVPQVDDALTAAACSRPKSQEHSMAEFLPCRTSRHHRPSSRSAIRSTGLIRSRRAYVRRLQIPKLTVRQCALISVGYARRRLPSVRKLPRAGSSVLTWDVPRMQGEQLIAVRAAAPPTHPRAVQVLAPRSPTVAPQHPSGGGTRASRTQSATVYVLTAPDGRSCAGWLRLGVGDGWIMDGLSGGTYAQYVCVHCDRSQGWSVAIYCR